MKILSINNLNKIYDSGKIALDNINLELEKGCFLGLLGPNGAGKSSLINILAGLVKKTSGKIIVNNFDFDLSIREAKFSLGIVPQELNLDPFFTVYETLENYAGYYGIINPKKRINDLIEILELTEKSHSKPRNLSGGMRRRLLIAKALIHNPPVLILDEPTAGVDIKLREDLWNYLLELNNQETSIILTTHYLEEAEKLCNKIAIINNGKITKIDYKENILKLLNTKNIIIKFDENITNIPEELLKISDCKLSDKELLIIYDRSKITIDEILKSVLKLEKKLLDIKTTEPDLQEIFKYLIHQN